MHILLLKKNKLVHIFFFFFKQCLFFVTVGLVEGFQNHAQRHYQAAGTCFSTFIPLSAHSTTEALVEFIVRSNMCCVHVCPLCR